MSLSTKFIDLTQPLTSSTQVYPSDPNFDISPHATHEKDGYAVQKVSLGTHTGTHIDAPYHFIKGGTMVDKLNLQNLVGDVVVADLSSIGLQERQRIEWAQVEPLLQFPSQPLRSKPIVLINTGWSKLHYGTQKYFSHPYLAAEVALELLKRGINVLGVDTLNPDETPKEGEAEGPDGFGFHETFLGAGGVIAENLTNLEELAEALQVAGGGESEGRWIASMAPLKLVGADGSPVRAFAYRL